jgi:hypothetical protein
MKKCFLLAALSLSLSGCAMLEVEPVKPWEKGHLARPEMALEAEPLLGNYRRHVQFSKEAASGEVSASGGGCGCN